MPGKQVFDQRTHETAAVTVGKGNVFVLHLALS
jgi:hypothetical protein